MSSLANVPAVLFYARDFQNAQGVTPPRAGKFILANVTQDGMEKLVFRSVANFLPHHRDILDALRHESEISSEMQVSVLGGGKTLRQTNYEEKYFVLGDESIEFGPADVDAVRHLLEEALPGWEIEVVPSR